MKFLCFNFSLLFLLSLFMNAQSQDTLVDVGGYNIYFKIIEGKGTPILFEAGGGNDSNVWNSILEKINEVTGTTLITYDRSGFGQSELNPNLKNESDYGIENGIKELETGLSKLGFNKDIILVSHSYGGLYNLLYASKHPKKVKSVILIDATLNNFWSDDLLNMRDNNVDISNIKKHTGDYYLNFNYNETMRYTRDFNFPANIPITNVFPEISFPGFPEIINNRWKKLHDTFGDKNKNVKNIIAQGSGHAIFEDNPALIINTIIQAYSEILDSEQQHILLKKALNNAIELSIDTKKAEIEKWHSENDLNIWGYSLMTSGELEKALTIFKLNTMLFPDSFNVFDSYAEALLKSDQKAKAIKMYEKSIELNPNNENAKSTLLKIKRE